MKHAVFLACLLLVSCSYLSHKPASDTQPEPLTNVPASVSAGEAVFAARDAGHCVLCHQVSSLSAEFQGNLGPTLDGIGARLSPGQIRYRIVDASRLNPATIMPPYYRTTGFSQVAGPYRDRPVLSAEQVEHLVAYLSSLRE